MKNIGKWAACAAFAGIAVCGRASPLPAATQANCEWYATTALKQQQENERLKCGYRGDAWSPDFKAHLAWCGSVAPDVWKRAAQQRDRELQACAKKK